MFRLNQVYESINTINISIRCFSESKFTKKKNNEAKVPERTQSYILSLWIRRRKDNG